MAAEITKADFFKPGIAPTRLKGAYDVTVVYFMDYQCPVCRAHTNDYARVFSEDPKVRVIYRDTPIFGPQSETAARLAIASQFQGKHEAFHLALMRSKGRLTDATIREAAAKAGVNWARLQKDLATRRKQIDAQISGTEGVSMDDEMANLLRFQRSYQAAAKALSTFDSMSETRRRSPSNLPSTRCFPTRRCTG